ncbi:hypothetical protein [Sphingomonas sp.]|uniref:hypothetical protein n=1 Tax=Sphingomonas sp. TaxID=28214 RepID=UPI001B0302A5|nr:hypothetical protein [Sphingomonas sp.]MBO9713809.1 hypothetical protein [Sphingomonas sp.]
MKRGAILAALALAGCGSSVDVSDDLLNRTAAGDPQAIETAAKKLPRTDPGEHGQLEDALARAMQVAPAKVLALVGRDKRLSAHAICVPFLAGDEAPRRLKELVARSRAAIESVTDPALARAKTDCLAEVTAAETALERSGE